MNKFELNDFLDQFVTMLEEGGSRIRSEAEGFGQNFKSSREIKRLESSIRDDYVSVGLLVYELNKMGKAFEIDDFQSKFDSIEEKKAKLAQLEQENHENRDEGPFEKKENSEEEKAETFKSEDQVVCDNCGALNPKYVAYCSNCGKEL